MNNFYVYIYLDPRKPGKYKYGSYKFEYEPFYVGKGCGERLKIIFNRTKYFKRVINKIKEKGLEPIVIKLKENLNEENSFILELELINLIGRRDLNEGSLLNFTDGGEGMSGWICSDETRKLISENNIGKHHSEETRKLMRENHADVKGENHPMFGKQRSEESKRKQSEKMKGKYLGENNPMFGKYHSDETRKKQSERMKGENHPMFGKHCSEESNRKRSEKMKGENGSNAILIEKNVIEIRKNLNEGILTQKQIGEKFGVKQQTISNIKNKKIWSHIKVGD